MGKREGKVALITGGTSGIGKATAQAFLQEGARVVIAARGAEQGAQVAEELARYGEVIFIQTDVNQEDQVIRVMKETVAALRRLDYAVNTPGITGPVKPLIDYSLDEWQEVVSANLNSMFLLTREQIKQLLAQGDGGFIVHVSSAIGKRAFANLSAYGATKRALESLIETAAQEYSSQGIIINGIAPGSVESATFQGFTNGGDPAIVQYLADTFHLVKRIGKPEVVANIILALCAGDPREAFVTGATIPVDGGWIFRQ